jgi:pectate lyase
MKPIHLNAGAMPVPLPITLRSIGQMIPSPLRVAAAIIALSLLTAPRAQAQAFPGAQGFGANATGGTTPYTVTNLEDSGPGSLRDAVSESGRLVTFSVAGTIKLESVLAVSSNTTLDGTSAPSPGITVTGFSTSLSKASNIIIRNMRFREDMTGGEKKCTIAGNTSTNIILDHCSIEWGRWDCLEFTATGTEDTSNITVQYCIIGEGLLPQRFGFLIDRASNISVHHNVFIDNESRNPKDEGNSQYICNVIYNWGHAGGLIGSHSAAQWKSDIINNFFLAGPTSSEKWIDNCKPTDTWYQSGNYVNLKKSGNAMDGSVVTDSDFTSTATMTLVAAPQFTPSIPVTIDPPEKCYQEAIAGHLGCQPLDDVDQRLIGYVKSAGTEGQLGRPGDSDK